MNICDTSFNALFFARKRCVPERLRSFGFRVDGSGHKYAVPILEGHFLLSVAIDAGGAVATNLVDTDTGEEYVLHQTAGSHGAFVGRVREEVGAVLKAVADACFVPFVFQSSEAQQVLRYARDMWQDEPEFLWPKFPNNAVLRRKDSKKWYAVLLVLAKYKLGADSDTIVDILDLRGRADDIAALMGRPAYFPGWHMNKKHWYTVCLDGSVPMDAILHHLEESRGLAGV